MTASHDPICTRTAATWEAETNAHLTLAFRHRARPDRPPGRRADGGPGPRLARPSGSFARVCRRLDDLHTVVYDRRGYHRSRHVLPLNTTLEGHVDDLLAVIDGRAAVVVGHTYGGDIALGAALLESDRVPPSWPSWPTTPDAVARGLGAGRRCAPGAAPSSPDDPIDPEVAAAAAERFFRRIVGDAAWERLPRIGPATDGPTGRPSRRSSPGHPDRPEAPFRCRRPGHPGRVRPGGRLGGSLPPGGDVAGRPHARRRTGGAARRLPWRPPDPPRRLRSTWSGALARWAARRRPLHESARQFPDALLISGSSGLIGTVLTGQLETSGHSVTRLVRAPRPPRAGCGRLGPGRGTIDAAALRRCGPFDGVVHLAGAGIGDKRWSSTRKATILRSRTDSTRLLVDALTALPSPPSVLISASAIGWYGVRGNESLTESSTPGTGFLAEVCEAWEAAARPAADLGIRTVHLRSGVVLSRRGGALGKLVPLFRFGVGGRTGNGRQYRSWITLDDEVGVIERCLVDDRLVGPVNATAPQPATDAELAKALGSALHRPSALPAPAAAIRLALGTEMADQLVLGGQRVLPAALEPSATGSSTPRWARRWPPCSAPVERRGHPPGP